MNSASYPRILQNKHYLYLTEFFSGMAVMAVEIGAQRLIAPYFPLLRLCGRSSLA